MAGAAIVWRSGLREAAAEARAEGKGLLVDFTRELCAACKQMDAVTFADPEVAAAVRAGWVPLKVNETYAGGEEAEFLRRTKVLGYPCVVLFSADGAEIARSYGFIPPQTFLNFLAR